MLFLALSLTIFQLAQAASLLDTAPAGSGADCVRLQHLCRSDDPGGGSFDATCYVRESLNISCFGTCEWRVPVDVEMLPGVSLQVMNSDCDLHIRAGGRVLLRKHARIAAPSIRMETDSFHLESHAAIDSQFSGYFQAQRALCPGSGSYGACYGGSGGRFFFNSDTDAPSPKVFDTASENMNRSMLDEAPLAPWHLASVWEEVLHGTRNAMWLFGSPSISNNSLVVKGGGRIQIASTRDVVLMEHSRIVANGEYAKRGVAGGSGGSVWIATSDLSISGLVEAVGGGAYCDDQVGQQGLTGEAMCAPAGGGGRVMISFNSSQFNSSSVNVSGGTAKVKLSKDHKDDAMLTLLRHLDGAPGTFLRVSSGNDGNVASSLIIQRNQVLPHSETRGGSVTPLHLGWMDQTRIDEILISGGAIVAGENRGSMSSTSPLADTDIRVMNGSGLVMIGVESAYENSGAVIARDIVLSNNAWMNVDLKAPISIQSRSMVVESSVNLTFESSLLVETTQTLHLDGNVTFLPASTPIEPTAPGQLVLRSKADVRLGGSLTVGALHVSSAQSIAVTGSIYVFNHPSSASQFPSCNEIRELPPVALSSTTFHNFTSILEATGSISVGDDESTRPTVVEASALVLCADQLISVRSNALLSSDGLGEAATVGIGAGSCVASLGGGGGYGGRGADSTAINDAGDYGSGGDEYGSRSGRGLLGSGGGCETGGAGGGIIMLGAFGVELDGSIRCNGKQGNNGGGGGSGGFLGLRVAHYLRGKGHISAVGGSAGCVQALPKVSTLSSAEMGTKLPLTTSTATQAPFCGGGGGGGRLQLNGCEESDYDSCTSGFEGNYTVAGGSSGTDATSDSGSKDSAKKASASDAASGSFFGFPCAPGYGGLFCRICPVGTYKSESNSEECATCKNAPSNSHYITMGSTTADCEWTCDPGYSGSHCVSPLQQLLDACGGEIGFVIVIMSIVAFFILIGYACRPRKEARHTRLYRGSHGKGERQHLLTTTVEQRSRFAFLLRCFYWPRVGYPKLLERDLPEHMARIYFSGTNEPDSPLRMRTTVPEQLKSVLYEDEFKHFAERINSVLTWPHGIFGSWGNMMYMVVSVLCFPWASEVMSYRRHTRINALKRIVGKYNHACMKGPRARGLLNAVKLGYSGDYSLVYLELLYKESSQSACVPTTKIGKPALPLVLLFAGRGTYHSPFYLDPSDLLVRSVPQCPELTAFIDEQWIEFVAELNELLRVVQRDETTLVETLLPVAQFLENKMALQVSVGGKLGGLRIYLGRFYVQDSMDCEEEFKLGLLITVDGSSDMSSAQNRQVVVPPVPTLRYGYSNEHASQSHGSFPRGLDTLDTYTRNKYLSNYDPYDASTWTANLMSRGPGSRRGSINNTNSNSSVKTTVSSIREEALRIRSSTSGSVDGTLSTLRVGDDSVYMGHNERRHRRRSFYEGWLGPVDASLPVPGVLICADELRDRLADRPRRQRIFAFLRLHFSPRNVPRNAWLRVQWMLNISLLGLLMVDLAITFALVVNLKCVSNGEVDSDCTASIMIPVLIFPPLAILVSPVMGIISLALSSMSFSRRYSVWNALSMANLLIVICVCVTKSSQLVAPWFTAPLPLLPLIALAIKVGEAYVVERYIAFQETHRRRRGWRGLMKRRLSDASIPPESP